MSPNVEKLSLRLPLKAELEKRTCNGAGAETTVQTARVHKLRRRIARQRRMRGIFKYSKTLRGLERQHTFKWTPCHVWHAKRCAMCGIWGWKMAVWRNDSAQRAAFRAAQSAATIFDASSWQSMHSLELRKIAFCCHDFFSLYFLLPLCCYWCFVHSWMCFERS